MVKDHWLVAGIFLIACAFCGCAGDPAAQSEECFPPRLLPSPDGKRLCVSILRGSVCRLATMRPDGSGLKILTDGSVARDSPAWSPDMRELVYSGRVGSSNAIFVLDLITGHSRQISHPKSQFDTYPSFSRDGSRVVFARSYRHRPYSMGGWSWNDWDVCVVNANGTGEKRLTHEMFYEMDAPDFSPDAQRVIFGAVPLGTNGPTGNIYELVVVNRKLRILTDGKPYDAWPIFAPTGKSILFTSDRGYEQRAPGPPIWTMDRHGRHIRQLVTIPGTPVSDVAGVTSPIYAPNGRDVFFTTQLDDSPHYAGWRLDVKGKTLRRIAGPEVFSDQ